MGFVLIIIFYAIISASGLALMKTSFSEASLHWNSLGRLIHDALPLLRNYKFIIGLLLYFGGFLIWLKILMDRPLSFAFPIASSSIYVAIVSVAYLFLGESISAVRLIGIAVILAGIILVGKTL